MIINLNNWAMSSLSFQRKKNCITFILNKFAHSLIVFNYKPLLKSEIPLEYPKYIKNSQLTNLNLLMKHSEAPNYNASCLSQKYNSKIIEVMKRLMATWRLFLPPLPPLHSSPPSIQIRDTRSLPSLET